MPSSDFLSLATNANNFLSSFEKEASSCTDSGANACVDVLDFGTRDQDEYAVRNRRFTGRKELEEFFRNDVPSADSIRIFFISQRDSWSPLNVAKDMLECIVNHHSIMLQVYDLIRCFKNRNIQTDDTFCCPVRTRRTSQASEICYSYRYADIKMKAGAESWVVRQSGVYHKYVKESNQSTWIMLFPMPSSSIEKKIKEGIRDSDARSEVLSNHMLLHPMLLSTCLPNWRCYFEPFDHELADKYNQIATTRLDEPLSLDDEALRRVHHLEQELQPLRANFKHFERVLTHLQEINNRCFHLNTKKENINDTLINFVTEMSAYNENAEFLVRRAQGIAKQISQTLGLKNQSIAQEQSENVFKLTKSTVDDSVTVRVITLVTLFYLPSSFIATVMGMNFFIQDLETRRIIVSPQFWIYFSVSIPLTVITIVFWRWQARTGFITKRLAKRTDIAEKSASDMA